MIEQTEMVVTKWNYTPPSEQIAADAALLSFTSLAVMKKRAPTKKGIACQLTASFVYENKTILEFVGEDSYVIDLDDIIDKGELLNMIRNSFSKFEEKFDFRKLGTLLHNRALQPLNETRLELEPVLQLLT
jgi:hypothetical protein